MGNSNKLILKTIFLVVIIAVCAYSAEWHYWNYSMGIFDPQGHLHSLYVWSGMGAIASITLVKIRSK